MALDQKESEAGLARRLGLFAWWSAPAVEQAGGAAQPRQKIRGLVLDAQAALQKARAIEAQSISELNHDLPTLVLSAARARDPQVVLDAQIEIATRVRRSGADCARLGRPCAALQAVGAASTEHAAAGGNRKAKAMTETTHA